MSSSSSRSSSQRPQPRKPSSRSAQAHVARRVEPSRSRPADPPARSSLIDDLERASGEGMTAHKRPTRPAGSASSPSRDESKIQIERDSSRASKPRSSKR